jgi:hypothetical protein
MFILARGGQSYARLRFNVGPGGEVVVPVEVDYSRAFAASDSANWLEEYLANVELPPPPPPKTEPTDFLMAGGWGLDDAWRDSWDDYVDFDTYRGEEYGYVRDF